MVTRPDRPAPQRKPGERGTPGASAGPAPKGSAPEQRDQEDAVPGESVPTSLLREAPILVTGAHRSGTTWVGKVLALAPRTAYLHEPFNPDSRSAVATVGAARWFAYVPDSPELLDSLDRVLRLRVPPGRGALAVRSAADIRLLAAVGVRRLGRRPPRWIVKDPLAVFSTEQIADRLGARPVVLIRHPAAFAASLLRLGWRHPFRDFLEQPRLMTDHLAAFEGELRAASRARPDALDEAILLWRCIYSFVDGMRRRRPDWCFVRHEDLSRDPVPSFERLYRELGFELTPGIRRTIVGWSTASNVPADPEAGDTRRDSSATIDSWKRRLTAEQVERVRRGADDVWPRFYGDSEW